VFSRFGPVGISKHLIQSIDGVYDIPWVYHYNHSSTPLCRGHNSSTSSALDNQFVFISSYEHSISSSSFLRLVTEFYFKSSTGNDHGHGHDIMAFIIDQLIHQKKKGDCHIVDGRALDCFFGASV